MSKFEVIKTYFGNVSMAEIKALSPEDRKELAEGAAAAMGVTIDS